MTSTPPPSVLTNAQTDLTEPTESASGVVSPVPSAQAPQFHSALPVSVATSSPQPAVSTPAPEDNTRVELIVYLATLTAQPAPVLRCVENAATLSSLKMEFVFPSANSATSSNQECAQPATNLAQSVLEPVRMTAKPVTKASFFNRLPATQDVLMASTSAIPSATNAHKDA
jgi:hypothetical protein